MSVLLYQGGLSLVGKSGVGQAILHQRDILALTGVPVTERWTPTAQVVHINTVLPDAVATALLAKLLGKKVVCYGHSTQEDFQNSFHGSNALAPLFRRWLRFCYGLGDVVVTPTEYSKAILEGYGIRRPVYALSNGVDTSFFAPSRERGLAFRQRWGIGVREQVVISVGHYIQRKGILDFLELAKEIPQARFFWFGYTDPRLVPGPIRRAIAHAPDNVRFPGFVDRAALRDAYCGADAFVFLSHEETEGIVVLEALACGIPTIVREIPVYEGWLENGRNVYQVGDTASAAETLAGLLEGRLADVTEAGREVARARSFPAIAERLRAVYEAEGLLEQAQAPGTAASAVLRPARPCLKHVTTPK